MIEWTSVLVKRTVPQSPFVLTAAIGVTALVAPPDSRTTDLVRVAAGLLPPRAGAVRISGKAPRDCLPEIGHVRERVHLPVGVRVSEYLSLGADFRKTDRGAVLARLEAFGLASLASSDLGELPEPTAKAIALVEALSAKAILLEEPRVALDPRAHDPLKKELARARAAGKAIVLTTSSVREARMADRLIAVSAAGASEIASGGSLLFEDAGTYRLDVESEAARALVASLSETSAVSAVVFRSEESFTLSTRDPRRLLEAIQAKVASGECTLRSMTWSPRTP